MEINKGDIVITLEKVERIRAIIGEVEKDMIGVVIDDGTKFDNTTVYGVALGGRVYYFFEDEIEKLEEQC